MNQSRHRLQYPPPPPCEECERTHAWEWATLPALWHERRCGRHLPTDESERWKAHVVPLLRARRRVPDNGHEYWKSRHAETRELAELMSDTTMSARFLYEKFAKGRRSHDSLGEFGIQLPEAGIDFFTHYLDELQNRSAKPITPPPYICLAQADLAGVDLRATDLRLVDLRKANLRGASIQEAQLSRSRLIRADLAGAHLGGSTVSNCDASYTKFDNSDCEVGSFVDSVLHDASFVRANLAFVDFSGANLERAVLANCDLTGATLVWGSPIKGLVKRKNTPLAKKSDFF